MSTCNARMTEVTLAGDQVSHCSFLLGHDGECSWYAEDPFLAAWRLIEATGEAEGTYFGEEDDVRTVLTEGVRRGLEGAQGQLDFFDKAMSERAALLSARQAAVR